MGRHLTLVAVIGVSLAWSTGAHAQVSQGDMNCDGVVDGLDIPLFVDCVVNGNCDHCGIVIETVVIGNPGNADDTYGYGGVSEEYMIGKCEVTNSQYCAFLNAVASDDTYDLYNTNMGNPAPAADGFGGIARSGSEGSYTYSVIENRGDKPVNWVSWYDTLRFANWLHNGQPTGPQDSSTTEDGAYDMSLGTGVARKPDARFFLPNEDEWYKAAYHKNDGVTGNYWDYPTASDTAPTAEPAPGTDMTNGSANYASAVGDVIDVGTYTAKPSDSPYGTFNQAGNVFEWTETLNPPNGWRIIRGGCFPASEDDLRRSSRISQYPTADGCRTGFRIAKAS